MFHHAVYNRLLKVVYMPIWVILCPMSIRNIKRKFKKKTFAHTYIQFKKLYLYNSTINLLSIIHWMFFLFISPAIHRLIPHKGHIQCVQKSKPPNSWRYNPVKSFKKSKILSLADSAVISSKMITKRSHHTLTVLIPYFVKYVFKKSPCSRTALTIRPKLPRKT